MACGDTPSAFAKSCPLLPRYLTQAYDRTARALVTSLFLPPPVIDSLLIPISFEIRLISVFKFTFLLFPSPCISASFRIPSIKDVEPNTLSSARYFSRPLLSSVTPFQPPKLRSSSPPSAPAQFPLLQILDISVSQVCVCH